ncbi:DUF4214 domain-containing protein [uncultured Sulfitobacter sp.]|uniref:DUF4214 domain-containing protein n=1 Tax=uncultured Sulfitobacter sp. TaxID=191468 RepID=UPI002610BE4C|nr:DUF4214 domain-containing protein [uncultured Sulfitobacter sp.]
MTQVLAPVGGGSNNGEVITLADGGFMAVWTHLVFSLFPIPNVTDESSTAILGRVFNADGTPRGEVFQVNETTADGQGQPDLTLLSNGNVAVAWIDGPNLTDFDVDAHVRIIGPDGTPVTAEMDVSTFTEGEQRIAQVAPTSNGGFVVSWEDGALFDRDETWMYQQYDAAGVAVGERVAGRRNVTDETSELLALGDDTFTIVGQRSNTFVLGQTYRTSEGHLQMASPGSGGEGNFNPFRFDDDYAADGQGNAVAVIASGSRIFTTFWQKGFIQNFQSSPYPDGTPPFESIASLLVSEDAVTRSTVELGIDLPSLDFTPAQDSAAAATYLPDGSIAVVWTGVSGGTRDLPEFSVYAQLVAQEGFVLSDTVVIADDAVQGSRIAPPFVSAGADGQLFIGWTGATDRNGAGTNELIGGTFTIPRKDFALQTDGDDVIYGTPQDDVIEFGAGADTVYLRDGDDVWIGGAPDESNPQREVFGMAGDDVFALKTEFDNTIAKNGGSGTDTLDFSLFTAGTNLSAASQISFERIIGTEFDDTGAARFSTVADGYLLHTGGGDDTVRLGNSWGGTWDGGTGIDTATSFGNRADYVITKEDGYYTFGYLYLPYQSTEPPFVQEQYIGTLRGVERIQFADELVILDPTPSLDSGSFATSFVPPFNPTGTDGHDNLTGDATDNVISGLGGNDTLTGAGGSDDLRGGTFSDYLYGDSLEVGNTGNAANQVYRLYQATLDREPDAGGHLGWAKILSEATQSLTQIASGFVNSAEFRNVYDGLDDAGFVGLMYQNVLGRTPDTAGLNGWLDVLGNGGSRADVVVGFSNSAEFSRDTAAQATNFANAATQANWSDDVYRLYKATLDRAPDKAGFEGWTSALASGTDFTTATNGFVNSREFQNTYGLLDDAAFVELLYQNVLGRAADAGGLAGWLDQLANGASRASVVGGFSQSGEFVQATAADLTAWMKGLGVDDTLDGGADSNILVGGLFADVFVFNVEDRGTHRVRDLEQWDALSLRGYGYSSAADVRAQMVQRDADVYFSGAGTEIWLENTQLTSLTDDMLGF